MKTNRTRLARGIRMVGLATCTLLAAVCARGAANDEGGTTEALSWPEVRQTARPWTRWWWPGSAVDESGLSWQLERMREAGLGGVEITPIYGALGYEQRYVEFLSPRWIALLEHTGREAQRLGLGVDMATGTGWPFGGPWIGPEHAAKKLVLAEGKLVLEPTGQQVKRAAPGGEGLVLDPYSTDAIHAYLARFDEAFTGFPGNLLRSQFHDSFEYYGAGGTPALEAVFEQQHGYRLFDWEPATRENQYIDPDTLARLKADYRTTLDSMHQAYLQAWTDWAHAHGWITRNQSHGAPANLLDLYAIADIPETEIFGSTAFPIPGLRRDPGAVRQGSDLPEPLVSRMASSAAHVMGKPLVSCETATWLRDHWKVTLAYVKPEIDRVLLDGINHVFYHGTVYSPPDAPWPGWLFYASTQFNPSNPWWGDFAQLNAYVTRVQSILQGGQPDNPILLYWPVHDIWHDPEGDIKQLTVHGVGFITEQPVGATARSLIKAGYAFDYISDAQICNSVAQDGRIRTPGGNYAAIVVPPAAHMPLETLTSLLGLAQAGATIVFESLPLDVPGFGRLEERRAALRKAIDSLQFIQREDGSFMPCSHGAGHVHLGDPVAILADLPGVFRESMPASGLDYIRRKTTAGWDYFIANLGPHEVDQWINLGTPACGAALLDPLNGANGGAALQRSEDAPASVYLQLAPGESIILRTAQHSPAAGPAWRYSKPAGPAIPITGEWSVSFIRGGPVLPQPFSMTDLASWTESGDPEARRFAGTARYAIEFDAPQQQADGWLLQLGDVRESATVFLNGELVGSVWSLPPQIRLDGQLRPGRNRLEIEVTNTAANRVRDMDQRGEKWKIMREINFVNINYKPFDASGWEIEPAGLLGPVLLQPLADLTFQRYPCQ